MASAAEQIARNMTFGTFAKAKDLQSRILFTLGILLLYRLGTFIPIPGVDPSAFDQFFSRQAGGMLGNLNLMSGGALERMSIFALNVMPYITASIIIQMMTTASPTLEALKKEGESGRKQINQYTRYLTLAFAVAQSAMISGGLASLAYDDISPTFFMATSVVTLTGGTMLLMWMGEQITARGIGNGISLIIFAGIVAELPRAIANTLGGSSGTSANILFVLGLAALVIALTVFIVFIERSQRRLLIQYPKRQQGNAMAQGQTSYLPLKLNTSGVIPPIFAIAILLMPMSAVTWLGGSPDDTTAGTNNSALVDFIITTFAPGTWGYVVTYGVLVAIFAFFYTSIMFNPQETADNLRKYGGFIPGIRPGKKTAEYIDFVLTRLTTIGAVYLVFVCILPEILRIWFDEIPFYIGGTSLLIVVSVTLDTVSQIQSHLIAHQYEGMMKRGRGGRRR